MALNSTGLLSCNREILEIYFKRPSINDTYNHNPYVIGKALKATISWMNNNSLHMSYSTVLCVYVAIK